MKRITFKLKDREIDLTDALPLTFGDWKKLKRRGVAITSFSDLDPEKIIEFVYYILSKADSTVTRENVEEIPFPSREVINLMNVVNAETEESEEKEAEDDNDPT